MKNIETGID